MLESLIPPLNILPATKSYKHRKSCDERVFLKDSEAHDKYICPAKLGEV